MMRAKSGASQLRYTATCCGHSISHRAKNFTLWNPEYQPPCAACILAFASSHSLRVISRNPLPLQEF